MNDKCDDCKSQRWIQRAHSWTKEGRPDLDERPFQQALWYALGWPTISTLRATKVLVPCKCNPDALAPWTKGNAAATGEQKGPY